jgi:hypothetical protein
MLIAFTMLLSGLANGEPGTDVRLPSLAIEYTYILSKEHVPILSEAGKIYF